MLIVLSKRIKTQLCIQQLRCYVIQAVSRAGEMDSTTTTKTNASNTSKSSLKMCGWQIHNYGNVDELQYSKKLRMPQIRRANECLVRVRATTVNPIDVAMLDGYGAKLLNALRCHPTEIEFPLTLGREFYGELVQCGMGVNANLKLIDRVWGVVPVHANGAHAEYVVVPDYCLSRAPTDITHEEAAAVLYAGLTAWSGLYITGGLGGICGATSAAGGGSADKRVLVLGGSGSVGSLAIQILKSQSVQVVATCSENAVELVRGIGADCVVDYKNSVEWESLRHYAPYDIILDCAGKGVQYAHDIDLKFLQYITFSSPLLRNIDSAGIGFGLLKNLADLMESNAKTFSKQGGTIKWGFFTPAPQGISFLKELVERKKLLPLIDSRFNFQQLPEAFKRVQCGHLRGKVVVNLI